MKSGEGNRQTLREGEDVRRLKMLIALLATVAPIIIAACFVNIFDAIEDLKEDKRREAKILPSCDFSVGVIFLKLHTVVLLFVFSCKIILFVKGFFFPLCLM